MSRFAHCLQELESYLVSTENPEAFLADSKFLMHLDMLEQLETIILSDDTGCFADQTGGPRESVFQTLSTLRVLKRRSENPQCPLS